MLVGGRSPVWRIGALAAATLCLVLFFLSSSVPKEQLTKWKDKVNDGLSSTLNVQSDSPYSKARFYGNTDLTAFQKPPQKIVGFILAGRREYVHILDCYL